MMNFNDKKTKRITAIIIIVVVLAMVLGSIIPAMLY